MNEYLKKALAIMLSGLEAKNNIAIQAMNMQALKGRTPNWQSTQFMANNNQELLQISMAAPNLLNGTVPQQQGNSELSQLIELAKASDTTTNKSDKKLYHLSNDVKALTASVKSIVDALKPQP
tara:strand:+ start:6300 stop:6668 length:369 start_codon:yes stop_codon:yes gene_type:complete